MSTNTSKKNNDIKKITGAAFNALPVQQHKIYEAILSSTPDFIYAFDLDRRFTYINKALLDMYGKTLEECVGKTFFEMDYEDWHAEMHDREIAQVIETKKSIRGEIPFTGTTGRKIYDYIFSPVFDDNGDVVAVTGTTRDITERKLTEEKLQKSEERLNVALEASQFLGTWDWDVQNNITIADPRFAALYGVDEKKALSGASVEEYSKNIHPDDMQLVRDSIAGALKGKDYSVELRLLQKDGSIRWVHSRGRVHFDENGVPVRFPGVTIDITKEKEAIIALSGSEAKFRQLADFMPQHIWTAKTDGALDYYNERCYEYTGIDRVDGGGKGWTVVVHPDDLDATLEKWMHSIRTGEPYEAQFRIKNSTDGQYRWFLARATSLHDDHGRIIKWLGTNTDIQDMVDIRSKAEEANIAKTEFLANMSHEIRTPMNAVIGLSNILSMSSPLTGKQKEYIQTLQMSADSLLALINDLLDISKIESRSVELEEISFNMTKLIEEVISMMDGKVKETGLKLTYATDRPDIDQRDFIGDPSRIRQILLNLCSNALKFTEKGSINIFASCEPVEGAEIENVKISVQDTGIGIEKDKLDVIFEKFVQANTSINRKYGGTGLGLAITKTLTEIMGGSIKVESHVNKGSKFTILLPLKVKPSGDMSKANVKDTVISQIQSQAKTSTKPQILLVEDYAPNVLVAKTFIESFGYDCDIANNGMQAIEKIKKSIYDAVLMDVQMPEMSGLEATKLVREYEKSESRKPAPIIGMTAHALTGDRDSCISAGMDDYVSKPFNPDALNEMLEHYINSNKE